MEFQSKLLSYERQLKQLNASITLINLGKPIANYERSSNVASKNQISSMEEGQLTTTEEEEPLEVEEINIEKIDHCAIYVGKWSYCCCVFL